MPAQITERPKRRDGGFGAAGEPAVSAQIVQFPTAAADDPDAATALARVAQALTKQQSIVLRREVGVLSAAIAKQIAAAEPVDSPEGLRPRHSEKCSLKRGGGACSCRPKWEAWVWSTHDKKKIRKTHNTKQEAIKWRRRHLGLAESGQLRAPVRITLAEVAYLWTEMARAGQIRNRSGRKYKPSALRTLETELRLRLVPELGTRFMSDIERPDLQDLVNRLQVRVSASKVRGCINSARVIWRDFDLVTGANNALIIDPTKGLRLPAVPVGGKDRVATADEARRLIGALKEDERALWATALYSGMRHGEIRALRAHNIDLALKRIKVRAGWDQYEGEIDPKTEKGRRTTIVIELLENLLIEHLKRTGRTGDDLVFGKDIDTPFNSNTVHNRARRAWKVAREREDEEGTTPEHERIRPIGLHDCRHTAVSQMLDAGITIDKVSKFIGHSSITVTIDRYGHLLPGGEAEAAEILNEYHARRHRGTVTVTA